MTDQQTNQDAEIVGMGVQFQIPLTIPAKKVWAAMVDKIYHTEKFLPVTDVKITDIIPGRHVHREMFSRGRTMKDDVHLDESCYKIRANVPGEETARVNIYDPETGILEYYQENEKGERISWPAPKSIILNAMKQTKETAEQDI